jgi:hypothetical protein
VLVTGDVQVRVVVQDRAYIPVTFRHSQEIEIFGAHVDKNILIVRCYAPQHSMPLFHVVASVTWSLRMKIGALLLAFLLSSGHFHMRNWQTSRRLEAIIARSPQPMSRTTSIFSHEIQSGVDALNPG